ncbi:MAG: sugar transferase [Myxococcota bacterium]|nr:sugar transferase [Myxococcota bacterium]
MTARTQRSADPEGSEETSAIVNKSSTRVFPSTISIAPKPVYSAITSVYNVILASLGLLVLAPVMLCIAVAVKLSSEGTILYRGERVGRRMKPFFILKFRTMKMGSESKIGQRLVRADEDHYTSIGRFLRKYRLDELPQLLNVVRRDMNLVGPRPLRPIFLVEHQTSIPGYERRFLVRPGITGQAQVRGGYYTKPRHKLFYDLLYISRRTIAFDLQLVILTFARVMTRIFTTTLLLCWLLIMVLVAPPEISRVMTISIDGTTLNILYLVPSLIALLHLTHRRVEKRRVVALQTTCDLAIFAFLGWTVLIIPFSIEPVWALRGLGWWTCNGFVVFYLVLNSRMVTDQRDALVAIVVFGTTLLSLLDVVPLVNAWIAKGQLSRLYSQEWSPILRSTIVVLALPWSITRSVFSTQTIIRRLYLAATVTLTVTAVLTLSRSGLIATTCATIYVLWPIKRRLAILAGTLFIVIIATLAAYGDTRMKPSKSVDELIQVSARQVQVLEKMHDGASLEPHHWLTGIGARVTGRLARSKAFKNERPRLSFSNMYLTILSDQGVVGLFFFLLFLFRAVRLLITNTNTLSNVSACRDLRAAVAGIVGCIFLQAFSDGLYQLPLMISFFAALGLAVGLATQFGPGSKKVYRIIQYRHHL